MEELTTRRNRKDRLMFRTLAALAAIVLVILTFVMVLVLVRLYRLERLEWHEQRQDAARLIEETDELVFRGDLFLDSLKRGYFDSDPDSLHRDSL